VFCKHELSFLLVGLCLPGQRCKQAIAWQESDLRYCFESSCDLRAPLDLAAAAARLTRALNRIAYGTDP